KEPQAQSGVRRRRRGGCSVVAARGRAASEDIGAGGVAADMVAARVARDRAGGTWPRQGRCGPPSAAGAAPGQAVPGAAAPFRGGGAATPPPACASAPPTAPE